MLKLLRNYDNYSTLDAKIQHFLVCKSFKRMLSRFW